MFDIEKTLSDFGLTPDRYEELLKDCSDKVHKVNTDIEWQDIVEKYSIPWNGDSARKAQQPILLGGVFVSEYYKWKESQNRNKNDDEYLKELRIMQREIEKAKVQARDERNEYKKLIREQARKESYKDQIIRTIQEYQEKPLDYSNNKQFNGIIKSDNDLLISFFDVHTGMKTSNFANEFDEKILKKRINQYLDKIFEVKQRHDSENAYVILSELVNGLIHPTLRIENNQNLIEQFLTIMDYLTHFIAELSYRFNEVHIYTVLSNHARITPNKDESLTGENMDLLAIPFLSAKLQNFDNILFHKNIVEQSIALFKIRNSTIASAHGDKDLPDTVVQKFTMFLNTKPDIIYLGHRHTNGLTTVYDTKVIQAGTLAGADSYCMDKRLRNKPEQVVSVITDKGLDCFYNVVFD